jgi:hypothetical protein
MDDTVFECAQAPTGQAGTGRSDAEESSFHPADDGDDKASKQNTATESAVTLCCRPQRQRKKPRRLEEIDSPALTNSDEPLGAASAPPTLPKANDKSIALAQAEKLLAARKLHAGILKGRNLGEKRRNLGKRGSVKRPRWTTDDIRLVKQSRLVSFTGGI